MATASTTEPISTLTPGLSPRAIGARLRDFSREFLGWDGVGYLFGKLAILAAVFFALLAGATFREANNFRIPELSSGPQDRETRSKAKQPLDSYSVIAQRNLFGSKAPVAAATPSTATAQQLKLRLVGTTIGKRAPTAILEDLNKSDQDVFDLEEMVFGRAKLVEILADSVRVQFNNKLETLFIDDGAAPTGEAASGETPSNDDQTEFTVPETELADALANLPLLLSQARAVPYFRNGQSIGMRLFAIRRDSLYEKLGLKNGDILTAVNENNLSDPSQALKIFEQLKNERSINVKLERNGENKDLHYAIR